MRSTCGFVHAVEELPRVRRESLDATPLPSAYGVSNTSDDLPGPDTPVATRQLTGVNVEVNVFEVVLPSAADADVGGGECGDIRRQRGRNGICACGTRAGAGMGVG